MCGVYLVGTEGTEVTEQQLKRVGTSGLNDDRCKKAAIKLIGATKKRVELGI